MSSLAQFKRLSRSAREYLDGGHWSHALLAQRVTADRIAIGKLSREYDDDNPSSGVWAACVAHFRHVACGERHFCAVVDVAWGTEPPLCGVVVTWGHPGNGRLGLGHTVRKVVYQPVPVIWSQPCVTVACGDQHSAAVMANGQLWMWGSGAEGKLGLELIHTHGALNVPLPSRSPVPASVCEVSCGMLHTVAVFRSGVVFACGRNAEGQCGEQPGRADRGSSFRFLCDRMP
jgi:hypothetical protein